jgi:O-antigen/teichoic acid export membrane protein
MISLGKTSKKIASNTVYQIVGKLVSLCVTVLATVIITRAYGKTGYGAFSLMQGWPALFFIIVDFGINAIATRELSKDFSKAAKYIGNILLIRILFSAVFMAGLFLVLPLFSYSPALIFGIRLGLLLILTQSLFATTNIIFQVKLRYDLSTIGYACGYGVILALIVVLSRLHLDVAWVNFGYVVGGFVTFGVNYLFVRKLGVNPKLAFDKSVWKYLLLQSLPLGLMFVFSQLNFKSDTLLLSILKLPARYGLDSTESVAVYALPYKVFEVSLVIPTFFMNSVYPILVRRLQEGREKMKKTFLSILGILAAGSVVASVAGVLLSPWVIGFLGGAEFGQSTFVLQLLLGGLALYFLTQPLSWLLVVLERQKYLPFIYLVGAIFDVTANFIFIPKYSFYASTVITHIAEFIILVLLVIFSVRAWREKYA